MGSIIDTGVSDDLATVAQRIEQEQFRALVNATNDALIMFDMQQQIVVINRRARYFFGLTDLAMFGKNYSELQALLSLLLRDPTAFIHWLTPLISAPTERSSREFVVLHPVPRILQCYSGPVLTSDETPIGRVLVFRDITREREVERMKNDFISIVSHELRTPLTSIRGSLQLVLGKQGTDNMLPARAQELLGISLSNVERLNRLLNDILDIAKIEQGRIQLRREPLHPAEVSASAQAVINSFAATRAITITLDAPTDLPLVFADRDRVIQVVTNLLTNAIKFSPPGQVVELIVRHEGHKVCFAVRDYGRGIALADQQRIFQKFYQIDSSTTRDVGGTGLGLAICKALVEEHNGKIWLDSRINEGSTFFFTLPVVESKHKHPTIAPILVVDDIAEIRYTLRSLLEQDGYEVIEAARGAEAVQLARLVKPALITLDIMMPEIDGLDVLQLLKSDPQTHAIPVLIISALPEMHRSMAYETAGFLSKPLDAQAFLHQVHHIVDPPPNAATSCIP